MDVQSRPEEDIRAASHALLEKHSNSREETLKGTPHTVDDINPALPIIRNIP